VYTKQWNNNTKKELEKKNKLEPSPKKEKKLNNPSVRESIFCGRPQTRRACDLVTNDGSFEMMAISFPLFFSCFIS
jgi:hypothetical protein